MTRDKQIVVALVILAGLGSAAYFQQKKDSAVGTVAHSAADLPTINGPEDLDKISITNGDKGEFVLVKDGEKWKLDKPVKALANQNNVKQLIDNLKELKVSEVVAPAGTDDLKKSYDLDPAHAVHVVGWKGADQKVDDTFGKLGSRGEMVMTGDKPAIYAAKGFSISLYNREQKGWRDTEIFKFDDGNASSITIDNANGSFSFTKGDKWAATFKGKPIQRYDDSKTTALVNAFKNLSADDFADGKSPAETGLDKPATITISLKDNAGKYVLHVGKTGTGTSSYAQKDGEPTIYLVTKATADWVNADEAKFQKPADGGSSAGAVAKLPPKPPGLPPGHPPTH